MLKAQVRIAGVMFESIGCTTEDKNKELFRCMSNAGPLVQWHLIKGIEVGEDPYAACAERRMPKDAGEAAETKPANSHMVGGDHYKGKFEHWDYVLANNIPYLEAQIIKYVTRWRKKNGLEDLAKAKHFLEKLMEHETVTYNKERGIED